MLCSLSTFFPCGIAAALAPDAAVDASQFTPNPRAARWPRLCDKTCASTAASPPGPPGAPHDEVVLVVLCRLVYRKGIDLLGLVLPHVCRRHAHVRVIIGGDGPKRQLLEKVGGAVGAGRLRPEQGGRPGRQAPPTPVGKCLCAVSWADASCRLPVLVTVSVLWQRLVLGCCRRAHESASGCRGNGAV